MPAFAKWAAMPLPMTPAPMTAARRIGLRIMTWLLGVQMPAGRRRIARQATGAQASGAEFRLFCAQLAATATSRCPVPRAVRLPPAPSPQRFSAARAA